MTSQPQVKHRAVRMSAEEFLAAPETNLPTELIDGEVLMSPAPNLDHQRLTGRTCTAISQLAPGGETFFAPGSVWAGRAVRVAVLGGATIVLNMIFA